MPNTYTYLLRNKKEKKQQTRKKKLLGSGLRNPRKLVGTPAESAVSAVMKQFGEDAQLHPGTPLKIEASQVVLSLDPVSKRFDASQPHCIGGREGESAEFGPPGFLSLSLPLSLSLSLAVSLLSKIK